MSDLYTLLPQADPAHGPWVLVTLVGAEGSTYRREGARLLVSARGPVGMISGGCLEGDIARRCAPVLAGEVASLEMKIDTRHLLGCDGRLKLVAERLPESLAAEVALADVSRTPKVISTFLAGPGWRPTLLDDRPHPDAFHQDLIPRRRMLVFGSTPGATPLLEMSRVLGWLSEQLVLSSDPRSAELGASWTVLPTPSHILSLAPDPWTACVVMNHHMGRDLEVLRTLWNTATPFLGLLGSHRRRDQLLEGLAFTSGSPEVDLDSRTLYAPVGIGLGGEGASEIALEICAQVQSVLAKTTCLAYS